MKINLQNLLRRVVLLEYSPSNGVAPSTRVAESDFYDFMDGVYYPTQWKVISDFYTATPPETQPWKLIPFPRLKKIWEDFSKTGFVRDERGLDDIADIVMENIVKVRINTELMGHTQGRFDFSSEEEGYPDLEQKVEEWYHDYCVDENGSWRISDYALDELMDDAARIYASKKAEEKLVNIDRALNRIHRRSDIAGWFVLGGSRALSTLSGTNTGE